MAPDQGYKTEIAVSPDVRVTEEDDTHIVIAVRLRKTWLARNMRFIAALIDCIGAGPFR